MTEEATAEIRRAVDAIRFSGLRECPKLESPGQEARAQIIGCVPWRHRSVADGPSRRWDRLAELEIVRIQGRVPKAFFIWFEERLARSRRSRRMLSRCWFEEVDE